MKFNLSFIIHGQKKGVIYQCRIGEFAYGNSFHLGPPNSRIYGVRQGAKFGGMSNKIWWGG